MTTVMGVAILCNGEEREPMKERSGAVTAILIVATLLCIGFLVGRCTAISNFEDEAVEKGFARYNGETGNWEWKEPEVEKEEKEK